MCRIAGVISKTNTIAALTSQVKQMCTLLKHGGPDGEGVYEVPNCNIVLGHRRLALLDLSTAGHQPMHYLNRYSITYNGELYNYIALKNELIADGYYFQNNTDTEVILAAFAKWNTNAFAKFNGMFAFALWDDEVNKMYLVRDRVGVKPLYFSIYNNSLAFASEVKAFKAIPHLQVINSHANIYQLAYGFIPEPYTTLQHVQALPKGCFLTYNYFTNTSNLQTFAFSSFSSQITNYTNAKAQINTSLDAAVQNQMAADARVGLFLSGGIDSTILANLASKNKLKEIHTVSIYFNEKSYSEKKYQDIVANQIGSTHHSVLLTQQHFNTHFSTILSNMDMPSCDGINTWFISKYASTEGLKAVLSGIGADELYGGYPSFDRINKAIILQKLPAALLQLLSKTSQSKYSRLSYLKIKGMQGLYLFLRGHFTPIQIAQQLGSYENEVWQVLQQEYASPTFYKMESKNMASWLEYNYYMQNQLLKDADVMSMAHGVEIRVPFLDNNVVDTAFKIVPKIKYSGKNNKQILIDSFSAILPKEIWDRPKMGFSFPFAQWLNNCEYVKALSISNNKATQKACIDFANGHLHWSRILSLILIEQGIKN